MSSTPTEVTEYSPSVPPPTVLCGSGIFRWLGSPWSMASSGHSDPSQNYDGYKALEFLHIHSTECLKKFKQFFQHYNPRSSKCYHCFVGKKPCEHLGVPLSNARWTNVEGPIPTCGRSIYSSEEVPISRTNNEALVNWIRQISDSSTDPDTEVVMI
ncbi:hypothetical protein O181_101878 [Austropuccinia psidii MF-1]|uniref:Uncharacterized protein n=1 Tax=Austropuccinia psidii MF-1 TaxID=1389203 RepID=A0A9Q3JFB4_9BASI|nr:hypothetical protein [Austropuccinia psidii MF-1]